MDEKTLVNAAGRTCGISFLFRDEISSSKQSLCNGQFVLKQRSAYRCV